MDEKEKKSIKRRMKMIEGEVVSKKMQKTAVVLVRKRVLHRTYKKYYTRKKHYKVHDPEERCSVGDLVRIVECAPVSKEKKWRLGGVIRGAGAAPGAGSEEAT